MKRLRHSAPSRRLTKATNSAGSLDATTATYERGLVASLESLKMWQCDEHGVPCSCVQI